MRRHPQHPGQTTRRGFTLIEILIVIVVIATLIALLAPAIGSVFGSARESQVTMEIRSLEQAIAAFKAQYGIEPPSSITLMEIASQIPARDQAILRRLSVRFNFVGNVYDWNGNNMPGEMNTGVTLRGAECLVFFLGGMRAVDPVTNLPLNALTGFSKNPSNPFMIQTGNGELRDGPFFEFKTTRLVTSNNLPNFLVYIDPLSGQAPPYAPYIYASTYEGRGYLPGDVINGGSNQLQDVYCLSTEDLNSNRVLDMGEDLNMNMRLDINYINPKTFQIISPGRDHLYGLGLNYQESAVSTNCNLANKADYDNLTNFHTGRLKP